MTPVDCSPAGRDRHLRLAGRLRVAVVAAGVVGSLGVAGAVAASEEAAGNATEGTPAATSGTVSGDRSAAQGIDDGDSFSRWRGGGRDQPVPQGLRQGVGPSHGSTGGS